MSNNADFDGTFLRHVNSRDHFGLIYGFPTVKDECNFNFQQIVGELEEPEPYKRGLFKFKLNFKSL